MPADIAELLAASEGKTLEFKRDLSSFKQIVKTVVAFANTAGGTLIIGKEDDGKVVGVEDPLLQEVGPSLRVTIFPHPEAGEHLIDVPANVPANVPVSERQAWFIEQLRKGKNCKASDLAAQWRITEKTAKRDIADLKKKELIRFVGATKTGRYERTYPGPTPT